MKRQAGHGLLALLAVAGVLAAGCGSSHSALAGLCAPHDTLCQTHQAALHDETCKNGQGSNQKCLDPSAPP